MARKIPDWVRRGGRPEVVCILGSTKFREALIGYAQGLTLDGHIVLTHGFYHHHDKVPITDEQKEMLDGLMDHKINICDTVFVVNPNGYIGESTKRAILHAREKGKGIRYLEEPSRPSA